MAFTDLTADINIMRDENTKFFTSYTDEQLTALKRSGAISRLEIDVITGMNLENGSTDILDEVATNYANRLSTALTFLQLSMFYFENSDGEGSITYDRHLDYTKRYNELKMSFGEMKTTFDAGYITTITKFKIG